MDIAHSKGPQAEKIDAPWTDEQVDALNLYQRSGVFHPFTSSSGNTLIATKEGWVESEGGPVVQTWAHSFMADAEAIQGYMNVMFAKTTLPPADASEVEEQEE